MTDWSFDPQDKRGTLTLLGDLTINHVGDLKERLLEAFSKASQVTVDVSAATAIDVAGIQLLCACQRLASRRGQQMCLRLGNNQRFKQFLDEVGFARDFICGHGEADRCFPPQHESGR